MSDNYQALNYNIENNAYNDQMSYEMWNDIGYENTVKILEEFTDEDWDQLLSELPRKSTIWKKRLCDCLWIPDPRCVKALLFLSETPDEEFFGMVIVNLLDLEEFINPEDMKPICKITRKWIQSTGKADPVYCEFLKRYDRSIGNPEAKQQEST